MAWIPSTVVERTDGETAAAETGNGPRANRGIRPVMLAGAP